MSHAGFFAEALVLGVSSGPACLASCGPVLVPILTADNRGVRGTGLALAAFLSGRLGGYLLFAGIAWFAGRSLTLTPRTGSLVFGLADVAMALLLAGYAWTLGRARGASCRSACTGRHAAPLLAGVVSGISLCPPFVAAGVRAAQGTGFMAALVFFTCFFIGTSIWFVPSLGVSLLRRWTAVAIVARFVLFLLAAYYAYLAVILLGGFLHG